MEMAMHKLPGDNWPEYYDGKKGTLIGRRANLMQTWSAAALIVAYRLIEDEESLPVFESINF
jgi:hypothetical protein